MSEINKISGNRFFENNNYDDDPMNFVQFDSIYEQKNARYEKAFDAQEIDNSDFSFTDCTNDHYVSSYPQIANRIGDDGGLLIFGKGIVRDGENEQDGQTTDDNGDEPINPNPIEP